jgi:hypothetical protein
MLYYIDYLMKIDMSMRLNNAITLNFGYKKLVISI